MVGCPSGNSRAIGLKIQLQSFFQGVAVMATTDTLWGEPYTIGNPHYEIVQGPGEWQLFNDGLHDGKTLCFTVKNRRRRSSPHIALQVKVTGAYQDAPMNRSMWYIQVRILGTTSEMFERPEEVILYYRIRTYHPKQSKGHVTCIKPFHPEVITPLPNG